MQKENKIQNKTNTTMCEEKGISKDFPPLATQKVSYQDTLNLVFKFNVFLQKQPGILFTLVYNLPG